MQSKYVTFNEMINKNEFCFYGVIYDASFPIYQKGKYQCVLKLIDKDTNVINLIVRATSKERVPYVSAIGDIIRVNRGNYANNRNVYLNVSDSSAIASWVIFAGEGEDITAISYSHKNYSFETIDVNIIVSLRTWIKDRLVLQNSLVYPLEKKLINRIIGEESDTTVLVTYKNATDDQIVYYVMDETDACELHTYKDFDFFNVKDVIRLKGYTVLDSNVIIMNQHSNMLKIPQYAWYYKSFMKRIDNKIDRDEIIQINKKHSTLIITPIVSSIPDTVLKHIDDFSKASKYIYIEVNVLCILPQPIYNLVNVLCPNCKSIFNTPHLKSIKGNNFLCPNCKIEVTGVLHYNALLYCIENINANKIIALHLCSYDKEGETLFGVPPCDCYRDSTAFLNLKSKIQRITSKENYIRVCCERITIKEDQCVYRVIGQYQQN